MNSKLSLVIPVYERHDVLDLVLKGLSRFQEIDEIILSENVSGGLGSLVLAEKYNCKYVGNDYGSKNFTKAHACNAGLDLVQNELVMFCDQDSWFPECYFEKIIEVHQEWQNLILHSDAYRIDDISFLHYSMRIPGNDKTSPVAWSTFEKINPLWDLKYVDGNCSLRTRYAKEGRWDEEYLKFGGEVRSFGLRTAVKTGAAPCIMEYIWYYHIEHLKDDEIYHNWNQKLNDKNPELKYSNVNLKEKLVPFRVNEYGLVYPDC